MLKTGICIRCNAEFVIENKNQVYCNVCLEEMEKEELVIERRKQ